MLNSRLGLCSAARGVTPGRPFSRSYGASLPSSLTRVPSPAWGCSPPPTCVGLRYGHPSAPPALFWSGPPPPSRLARAARSASDRGVATSILAPGISDAGRRAGPRVARGSMRGVVSDYQPIVHRLRLDACGLGPTNPTRMHLASETSGLRRARFPRALSLLIPAFALRRAPRALPGPASPRPNAPLPPPQR